jgi:spermidine/putrescine transport system permease protein
MVSGYSPLVPTLGMLSVFASVVIIAAALMVPWLLKTFRRPTPSPAPSNHASAP